MTLEYVVRPFQSPRSQGAVVIPSTPQNTHEKATITWGATTKLPDNTVVGISVIVKDTEDLYETKRTVVSKGIRGAGDSRAYVWMDRATSLEMTKITTTDNRSGQTAYSSADTVSETFENFMGDISTSDGTSTKTSKVEHALSGNTRQPKGGNAPPFVWVDGWGDRVPPNLGNGP